MLLVIALVIVYAALHTWKSSKDNLMLQIAVVLHATVTLYVAISALAAFTLTRKPPLADAFEQNEWRAVGVYIFLAGLFFAVYHGARTFRAPFRESIT